MRAQLARSCLRARRRSVAYTSVCAAGIVACSTQAVAPLAIPPEEVAMPEYTGTLLAPARLSGLPGSDASSWNAYLLRSRQRMQADLSLVARERARTGGRSKFTSR